MSPLFMSPLPVERARPSHAHAHTHVHTHRLTRARGHSRTPLPAPLLGRPVLVTVKVGEMVAPAALPLGRSPWLVNGSFMTPERIK